MSLSLTDHERGLPFDGDPAAALAAAQERLGRLQLAQIVGGTRAIVVVDGWQASGRRQALKALAGSLDPCRASFHCLGADESADGRHWLAPYWSRLPRSGETAVFLRGWYREPVEARVRGELGDKEWARAFDEINEFEAQQTEHGTLLVKLFFHVAEPLQARRLRRRAADPWLRLASGDEAQPRIARSDYVAAWEAMFARSNTRWAGWTIIDAGDESSAQIAALTAIGDALAKAVPSEPPQVERAAGPPPEVVEPAQAPSGYRIPITS
jgi:polyphosphate kinase 2 (PPK2 family)